MEARNAVIDQLDADLDSLSYLGVQMMDSSEITREHFLSLMESAIRDIRFRLQGLVEA